MKYGIFVFILLYVFGAVSTSAFELKNNERHERDLRIEIEVIPSPVQHEFDKYIQELAAAAQRDAQPEERARKEEAAKDQQIKVLNPIVLFRW
jgi:hypothetical protein